MVMSGSQRSKEDDVQKISTSVFVTNFPDGYGAKDLWNTCKLYGHVVDVFIPDRRTKAGKRFGFVRFIKGTNNVNHGAKGMTNYYAHLVKGNQVQNVGMEDCPNMVLDETCLSHEDFSLCLLGKVKEFASLTNLKVIIQAHNDFLIDERVIWVEVEGVPCKWWSRNTFIRIASRWGMLLNGEELEEEGYHSNRICIRTKLKTVVFDSFKMVYRGMTCWVRAIEGWVPDFEEDEKVDNWSDENRVNDGQEDRARLHKKSLNSRKSILKAELADLDGVIDKGEGSDADGHQRREVVRLIQEVEKVDAMEVPQKAKIKWSIKGDENSKYYHGMLNKKRGRITICEVLVDGIWMESPHLVKHEFFEHFKNRFEKPNKSRILLERDFVKRISLEQNDDLERELSNEEIKRAVWDCGIDKAPELDEILKGGNSSFITLIPKVPNANMVTDFRPISLIGSLYKVITKVLVNRLVTVLDDIVDENSIRFCDE
nr:RNA-directed DNA polymerase, eukaryota [Tanacetum cinerariifolium]